MNLFKNITVYRISFLSIILLTLFLFSCKKYPEDHGIVTHTIKSRLISTWQLYNLSVFSNYDSLYSWSGNRKIIGWWGHEGYSYNATSFKLNFYKSGGFVFLLRIEEKDSSFFWGKIVNNIPIQGNGRWELINNKSKIRLTFSEWNKNGVLTNESPFSTSSIEEYEIRKLTKSDFKLKTEINGKTIDLTFSETDTYY